MSGGNGLLGAPAKQKGPKWRTGVCLCTVDRCILNACPHAADQFLANFAFKIILFYSLANILNVGYTGKMGLIPTTPTLNETDFPKTW